LLAKEPLGHSILVIFYHMLKAGTSYADLGGDFFDRLEPQRRPTKSFGAGKRQKP